MPDQQPWHALSIQQAFNELGSRVEGLTTTEVAKRHEQFGPNALPREKPISWITIMLRQLMSPLMIILFVAALASYALGDVLDTEIIFIAIALNAVVGFVQEFKANRALERLRAMVQPHAQILRDGAEVSILAEEVVPGDILLLSLGDQVVADARLMEVSELEVNEAPLTGESMPIAKSVDSCAEKTVLAERKSMVYTGTSIVAGRARAIVVVTGLETELGNIAQLVHQTAEERTPLQVELSRVARWLSVVVVFLITIVFFIGVGVGRPIVEMFETSIALAVAAVPEGLAVSVTVVLAIGMQRILRRKALVRRLVAAETLGSVSVICTDKTGTITEGEMRVTDVVLSGNVIPFAVGITSGREDFSRLLEAAALCNDAVVEGGKGPKGRKGRKGTTDRIEVRGTPTEASLTQAIVSAGIFPDELRKTFPRIGEMPFDSSRKFMATLHKGKDGRRILVKGAPEKVLGFVVGRREQEERVVSALAERGLRVLAVAEAHVSESQDTLDESDLHDLTLLGFFALQDPLRATTKEQIRRAAEAGVRTVMITGDHPKTALAIASEAGLKAGVETLLTGAEFDALSDEELKRRVASISVYARVEPRHKLRIVDAWQSRGAVVAMTGDGVNDAPAIKGADIGIALGSGTEVAKGVADLVLLDNNLGTITAAIEEGRVIFDNIRKTLVYLMADSFTEIILIAGALVMGLPAPLLPLQILWINLVADSLPTVGLTLEPGEPDVMKTPPRPRKEHVLNREMITLIFVIGVITDIALLFLYNWYLNTTGDVAQARTIMFAAVGIDSLLYVFAIKSFRRSIFRLNPFSNPWLVGGVLIGFALMAAALFVPFFQRMFNVASLGLSDGGLLLMIGLVKLAAIEVTKEIFTLFRTRRNVKELCKSR